MELSEAIKGRRSIRSFKERDITEGTVKMLIDAARWAPSAGNIQPWTFIVVRKHDIKRKLAQASLSQMFIEEAPVVIVVCADEERSSMGYDFRGRNLYCIQDTAAATQNILLTAYSLGLGACWIGAFNEDEAKEVLKAPEGIRPVVIIPVGFPNEAPSQGVRRPLSQVMRYETF